MTFADRRGEERKARQYDLDMEVEEDRMLAAEEPLAKVRRDQGREGRAKEDKGTPARSMRAGAM